MKRSTIELVLVVLFGCAPLAIWAAATQEQAASEMGQVEITVMLPQGSNIEFHPEAASYQAITEATGVMVNLQPIPSSDYNAKLNTLIATNDVPDVARVGYNSYYDFAASGVFLAIDDLVADHAPNFDVVRSANPWIERLRIEGTLYGFPWVSRDDVTKSPLPFIRMDLLDAQGLSEPTTFAELRDTLALLKRAYPNTLGYITRGPNALRNIMMYAMGSGWSLYFDDDVDGGRYVYGPATEAYRRNLEYLAGLYRDGLIDPDYAVTNSQAWQEKGGSGKGLFAYDNPIFMDRMNRALQSAMPDARFGFIGVPADAGGNRRYRLYDVHPKQMWVIGANNPQSVRTVQMFNWLYSDEGADTRSLGIEGEHWDVVDGEKRIKQSLIDEYRERGDPYSLIQSEVGIAFSNFVPYYDNMLLKMTQIPLLQEWWFERVATDPARDYPLIDPPLSADERERIRELRGTLSTLEQESFDKFVTGALPMSQFDDVAAQMRAAGYEELEQIYNRAHASQ